MTYGSDRIAAERERQINEKGYDQESDRGRAKELMAAAECYILVAQVGPDGWHNPDGSYSPPGGWPWDAKYWNPSEDTVRNLEKAGALIAAAIDAEVDKNA